MSSQNVELYPLRNITDKHHTQQQRELEKAVISWDCNLIKFSNLILILQSLLISFTDISSVSPGYRSLTNIPVTYRMTPSCDYLWDYFPKCSICCRPVVQILLTFPLPGFSQTVGQVETNLRKSTQSKAESPLAAQIAQKSLSKYLLTFFLYVITQ